MKPCYSEEEWSDDESHGSMVIETIDFLCKNNVSYPEQFIASDGIKALEASSEEAVECFKTVMKNHKDLESDFNSEHWVNVNVSPKISCK